MWAASRLRSATALALTLACASVVLGADESAPVEKPDVKVGEWWRYRATSYPTNVPKVSNYRVRVAFVGPGEILTVGGDDKESVWTAEWSPLSFGGSGVAYDKPRRLINFPLKVGSSHSVAYEVVAARGSGRSRYQDTVKVIGWEDVVVPAGSFRALKLEVAGTYQRVDVRAGGWTRQEIWYVPQVKRWVKWTYGEGPGGAFNPQHQKSVDELIEFRVNK